MPVTTVHYPVGATGISTHSVTTDDEGYVFSESGVPAPEGVELLDHDALMLRLAAHMAAVREDHEARVTDAIEATEAHKAAHAERLRVLTSGGLSAEAAEALVGPAPVHEPRPFTPHRSAEVWLSTFGLSAGEIRYLLSLA